MSVDRIRGLFGASSGYDLSNSNRKSAATDRVGVRFESAVTVETRSVRAGILSASNAKLATDLAASAISEITSLRADQLSLAKRADEALNFEAREGLNTEFLAIEAKIQEIVSDAEVNGTNVLAGNTLTISSSTQGVNNAVSLINAASITQNYNGTAADRTGNLNIASDPTTAINTLTGVVQSGLSLSSGSQVSASKAATIADQEFKLATEVNLDAPDFKEANSIARSIASDISSGVLSSVDLATAQGGLNSETVSKLLGP